LGSTTDLKEAETICTVSCGNEELHREWLGDHIDQKIRLINPIPAIKKQVGDAAVVSNGGSM